MASNWPFMAKNGVRGVHEQVRFIETKPLEFLPPPGFLPDSLELPEHCKSSEASPRRVRLKVLSADGKPPRDTFLFLRPVTLDKIVAAVRRKK